MRARRKLYEEVVDELGLRIVQGDYQTGDALPNENDLCDELDVSRTVIREATKVLSEKGVVESRRKVGTVIQPRSSWNLLDPAVIRWQVEGGDRAELLRMVTELRRVIEPGAAALAAQRATDDEIVNLEEAFAELEAATGNPQHYITTDLAFHNTILEACQNALFVQIARSVQYALRLSRETSVRVPDSSREALPLHRAVLEAIRDRDPEAARQAMVQLVERAWADIEQALEDAAS